MQDNLRGHMRSDLLVEVDKRRIQRRISLALGPRLFDIIRQLFPVRVQDLGRPQNLSSGPINGIHLGPREG